MWKITKYSLPLFASLLCLSLAQAHGPIAPREGALETLEGVDSGSKKPCYLYVMSAAFEQGDQLVAKVETSYSHDSDAPAPFAVRSTAATPKTLVGKGSNGQDQIAIFIDRPTLDLSSAKYFNLKWLHGNHFHTDRCVDLRPHRR